MSEKAAWWCLFVGLFGCFTLLGAEIATLIVGGRINLVLAAVAVVLILAGMLPLLFSALREFWRDRPWNNRER